jgi:hypothetical protein
MRSFPVMVVLLPIPLQNVQPVRPDEALLDTPFQRRPSITDTKKTFAVESADDKGCLAGGSGVSSAALAGSLVSITGSTLGGEVRLLFGLCEFGFV